MKKGNFYGWENVFVFTLKQLLKTPSMLLTIGIMFLFTALILPIMNMSNKEDEAKTSTSIEELLIIDSTGIGLEQVLDFEKMEFKGVLPEKITYTDKSLETVSDELKDSEESTTACIEICFEAEMGGFHISGIYGSKSQVDREDVDDIANLIGDNIKAQLLADVENADEKLAYINADIETEVVKFSLVENDEKNDEHTESTLNMAEYGIVLFILVIVVMFVSISGEQVASAVLQEKASKVVETLLTSVKPLALLLGKILAVFVISILNVVVLAIGLYASTILNGILNPGSSSDIADIISGAMAMPGEAVETVSLNPFMIPLAILILLCGTICYAVLAAVAGACVSRMEELTEGMKLYTMTLLIGTYFGMFVVIMDMAGSAPEVIKNIGIYLPFSATSLTPAYLLLGKISAVQGLVSLAIMVVTTASMFWFASTVYVSLIYHNGNAIKLKELLMINKNERRSNNEK